MVLRGHDRPLHGHRSDTEAAIRKGRPGVRQRSGQADGSEAVLPQDGLTRSDSTNNAKRAACGCSDRRSVRMGQRSATAARCVHEARHLLHDWFRTAAVAQHHVGLVGQENALLNLTPWHERGRCRATHKFHGLGLQGGCAWMHHVGTSNTARVVTAGSAPE